MVKKLFALASVTALTGLMAAVAASGCSSSTTTDTPAADSGNGGDAKPPPPKGDAQVDPEPEAGPTTCPTTTPITEADANMAVPWVPPLATQSVCTQADIDKLKDLFNKAGSGGVKFSDMKTALGTTCSACAFSPIKGTNWQPIVEDGTGGALDNRVGSCFALTQGTPLSAEAKACGKARSDVDTCLDIACPVADCADSTGAVPTACTTKALNGACKDLAAAYTTACPFTGSTENDALAVCGNLAESIVVACAGGPDAGIDASTN